MANRKVTLVANVKTERGWRRYPVAWGKNGRIKPGTVMIPDTSDTEGEEIEERKFKEQKFTDLRYQLRTYEGSRMVYRDSGTNAQDAVNARDREVALLMARESATAAGAKVVEPESRVYLRRAIEQYKQSREHAGALEALEQASWTGAKFLTVSGRTFVDEIVEDDVLRFYTALRREGYSPRTIHNRAARLRSILLHAGVARDQLPALPKYEKALPTVYTTGQVKAIRQAAEGCTLLAIDLGLKCGLREQEMMHLEWEDIHWTDKVLRVQGKPEWGFAVKDSEQREVPVPNDMLKALRAYRRKHPKTRLVLANGDNKPNGHLLRNLKQLARRANLNCDQCDGCKELNECQQWTLHKLRRTYATTLLRNGVDLRTVQRFMGHTDLASTMRYLRPASGREVQHAVNAIKWD